MDDNDAVLARRPANRWPSSERRLPGFLLFFFGLPSFVFSFFLLFFASLLRLATSERSGAFFGEFYLVFTGFRLSFIGFDRVSLGFTGFYWVLLGFIG